MELEREHITTDKNEKTILFSKLKLPAFTPYWHFHPELELTYIVKGKGLRFVGDHIAPFQEGDLVLLGENLPHQWVSDGEDDEVETYIFQFSKVVFSQIPEFKKLYQFLNSSERGIHFTNPSIELIGKIIQYESQNEFQQLLLFFDILNLSMNENYEILSSENGKGNQQIAKHSERITKVLDFVLEHMNREITLTEISDFTGMTSPAFCRWFKKSIGKSFVTYLNQLRVEKASTLLWEKDLPISQIAFETGFESLSNFNRSFLKYKGCSPREYRKQFSLS
ncbi:helix-turn-helix domain-containing protein [Sediminitomix flava]|uniref:AraC family transcriptional regulator n=1 Tax=Sediminitomix flava TaxID=379075 RepID=A0A315Z8B3_SEDFL|nr:AraC family transcriptional regulator [Sediminitomix flava]PWJ39940.1 AraC family transcriptional regulator [Sediminitomix flava]